MGKYPESMKTIRRVAKEEILKILMNKGYDVSEIVKKIKSKNRNLCDDTIKCACGNVQTNKPEWVHQIRWALQDLKYQGKIQYDKTSRIYSILNEN